ncbi:hypothetical protein [Alkalihalobacillus deserti]|uniref:hypothetical protein n=1 Tax=Alkalihalobacillus deserti TaxID=2879466 RepID=UPI001D15B7AB|nr:hypothetical protein [Alkalihalobacillus deserti]
MGNRWSDSCRPPWQWRYCLTSCGNFLPFCHQDYGTFFEKVADEEGLSGWATTMGGSSDTRIWAGNGIQSVNLSAGYWNEHTDEETLDVVVCYQTAKLLKGVLKRCNELKKIIRKINRQQPAVRNREKRNKGCINTPFITFS